MTDKSSPERCHQRAELFSQYYDKLHDESPRGSVIVAASILDRILEDLIVARLRPMTDNSDPLLSGAYAPLGSFAAKIDTANRLGLIRPEHRKALHILRNLRNEFAHDYETEDFDASSCLDRVRNLATTVAPITEAILSSMQRNDPDLFRRVFGRDPSSVRAAELPDVVGPRLILQLLVAILASALRDTIRDVVRVEDSYEK
jgi:DNA-binding MltR family transcriptional regulator